VPWRHHLGQWQRRPQPALASGDSQPAASLRRKGRRAASWSRDGACSRRRGTATGGAPGRKSHRRARPRVNSSGGVPPRPVAATPEGNGGKATAAWPPVDLRRRRALHHGWSCAAEPQRASSHGGKRPRLSHRERGATGTFRYPRPSGGRRRSARSARVRWSRSRTSAASSTAISTSSTCRRSTTRAYGGAMMTFTDWSQMATAPRDLCLTGASRRRYLFRPKNSGSPVRVGRGLSPT